VTLGLRAELARAEPDPEIQDLLYASAGTNLGVDFLPGALPFAPATGELPDPGTAADVVWLDAYLTNVDRTARNTNMLWWHRRLYLIDHGACLYFHHDERRPPGYERTRFAPIREHVLLPHAGSIVEADARLAPRVTEQVVRDAVDLVPDAFLEGDERAVYRDYLRARIAEPREFVEEAEHGRS
jgi:hypothetical protein